MSQNKLRFFRVKTLPTSAQIGDICFVQEDSSIYIYTGEENPWEQYAKRVSLEELLSEEIDTLDTESKLLVDGVNELVEEVNNPVQKVTYAELVAMRDKGQLVTGKSYRIVDYVTTTTSSWSESADHTFDLIVTATSPKTINENVKAVQTESLNLATSWDWMEHLGTGDGSGVMMQYCGPYTINGSTYDWYKEMSNDVYTGIEVLMDLKVSDYAVYVKNTQIYGPDWAYIYDVQPAAGDDWEIPVFNASYNTDLAQDLLNIRYFSSSNINAWEIKYSLDNDQSLYEWADPVSGRGVIYHLKDEYGNECAYDFKNIKFRNANNESNLNFYYTFSDVVDDVIYDKSLNQNNKYCYLNVIQPYHVNAVCRLNRIIFVNREATSSCYGNIFGINCYNNTFTNNCTNNKFGNHCKQNIFGDNFQTNTFGNNCSSNVFNAQCYYNTFGTNCHENTMAQACSYNSFGNNCYENKIGSNCNSNSFGNNCYGNVLGNYNYNNSFGNYCFGNTHGANCYSNSMGNSCQNNLYGKDCSYNNLGNNCRYVTFGSAAETAANYYSHIRLGDGVQYIILYSTDTASSNTQLRNCRISQGIHGSSSSRLSINISRNRSYETIVGYSTSGTLKTFCAAG